MGTTIVELTPAQYPTVAQYLAAVSKASEATSYMHKYRADTPRGAKAKTGAGSIVDMLYSYGYSMSQISNTSNNRSYTVKPKLELVQILVEHVHPNPASIYTTLFNLTPANSPPPPPQTQTRLTAFLPSVPTAASSSSSHPSAPSASSSRTIAVHHPPPPPPPPAPTPEAAPLPPPQISKFYPRNIEEEKEREKLRKTIKLLHAKREAENKRIRHQQAQEVAEEIAKEVWGKLDEMKEEEKPSFDKVKVATSTISRYVVERKINISSRRIVTALVHRILQCPYAPLTPEEAKQINDTPGHQRFAAIRRAYRRSTPILEPNKCPVYRALDIVVNPEEVKRICTELAKLEEENPNPGRSTAIKKIGKIRDDNGDYIGYAREMGLDGRNRRSATETFSRYLGFDSTNKIVHDADDEEDFLEEVGDEEDEEDEEGEDSQVLRRLDEPDEDIKVRQSLETSRIKADVAALKFPDGSNTFYHQAGRPHSHGSVIVNKTGSVKRIRFGLHACDDPELASDLEVTEAALSFPALNTNPAGNGIIPTIDEATRRITREHGTLPTNLVPIARSAPGKERANGQKQRFAAIAYGAANETPFSSTPPYEPRDWIDMFVGSNVGSLQGGSAPVVTPNVQRSFLDRLAGEVRFIGTRNSAPVSLAIMDYMPLQALGIVAGSSGTDANLGATLFGTEAFAIDLQGQTLVAFVLHQPNGLTTGSRLDVGVANVNLISIATVWPSFAQKRGITNTSPRVQVLEVLKEFLDLTREEFQIARYKNSLIRRAGADSAPITSFPSPVQSYNIKDRPPGIKTSPITDLLVKPRGQTLCRAWLFRIGLVCAEDLWTTYITGRLDFVVNAQDIDEVLTIQPLPSSDLKVCEQNLKDIGLGHLIKPLKDALKAAYRDPQSYLPCIQKGQVQDWLINSTRKENANTKPLFEVRTNPTFPHGSSARGIDSTSTDLSVDELDANLKRIADSEKELEEELSNASERLEKLRIANQEL